MSIFINHIVEKIDISVYENVFSQHGPVYFGIYDKTKKFIDNKFLNFKASLPSYIEKNEIIDYAENYDQDIEEIYLQLKKEFFDRYCYFLSRSNQNFVGGVYDYLYFFRIHIKAASRFLDENNIQYLFIAPASLGFDNILYEVAKIKKKKTICIYQSHNNRFFWMLNWNDMGRFLTSLPIFPSQNISVKKKLYDPFYMIRVLKPAKKKNIFISKIKKYFSLIIDNLRPFVYGFALSKKIFYYNFNKKYSKPADWLEYGSKFKYLSYKYINIISSNLRENLEKKYNFDQEKYIKILFFLKVQPEATEGFSSSVYDDQSNVIDKLQKLAPPNTKIFIKEHPDEERNDPMARANFWNSISRRKNIYVLPIKETPLSLFKHFDVIATLEGSVGWEALRNLKPVICFGFPWYLSMPGAFYVDEVLDFKNILKKKWTINDLNRIFTELTKKMGIGYANHIENGYIDASDEMTNYEPLTSNEKKKKLKYNDQIVAGSLFKIFLNIKDK